MKSFSSFLAEHKDLEESLTLNDDYFRISPSLLIRLMEYARETIKDDLTIHKVVDNMNACGYKHVFSADDYLKITKK